MELQGDKNTTTVVTRYFNTTFPAIDRISRQKMSTYTDSITTYAT